MVVAAVAYFAMYDVRMATRSRHHILTSCQYPENANFLTDAERAWLVRTLRVESTGLSRELRWTFLVQALKDPRAYLMIALFLVCVNRSTFFLPYQILLLFGP